MRDSVAVAGSLLLAATIMAAPTMAQQAMPGGEWLTYNNGLHGQRYSPLKQIDAGNAARLGEVCRVQIDGPSSFHAGLIVQGDTLYTATPRETVALDATTCALRWKFTYRPEEERCGGSNRGVALADGRIFRGTCDGRLIALDAATGRLLWKSTIAVPQLGESTTAVPLAWGGVVYMGIGGSELGVRGRVMAFDAATGRELWRFHTIPMGEETGAETWERPETAKTGGGGVWGVMSLDVSTGELFVPVGNPWPDIDKDYRPGANLFTNSIVVLDARTGALKWWYQVSPADWMDLDLVAAPVLYRADGARDLVAIAGKDGYVTVLDRDTRKVVFRTPVTTVQPVPDRPSREGLRMCPGYAGGVEWNGPALDRLNNQLIVGSVDICFNVKLSPPERYTPGAVEFGGSVEPVGDPVGWITAIDPVSGTVKWKYRAERPVVAGVTPTAGGVTFAGDLAGNFMVFESATGRLLHRAKAGGAMAGGVVTYDVGGRQYVAFAAGNISRNAFGDLGMPSVVVMTLDPGSPPVARDVTGVDADADARGQLLYGQVCQSCHGPDGNMIPDRRLSGIAARQDLAATIAYIKDPKPPMPRLFPSLLGEADVRAVATWIHEELR
ncbi:MAG: PQQ-binding-like beta-propeller repeat protein [Pseudomonadota bacterium]|jgi:alcohol dehydrogenase (cytochrome c)|nr:MAG: pyrrolo-quinoline quinone [Pseudomonadota bacterium]